MESPYKPLGARLGIDEVLWPLAEGQLRPIMYGYDPGRTCADFPPALWPLLIQDDVVLTGWWVHWFSTRKPTIVDLDRESSRAQEIARTAEQYAIRLVLTDYVNSAGPEEEKGIRQFASETGIPDFAPLEALASDDPKKLVRLTAFRSNPPLGSVDPAQYNGEFPLGHGRGQTPFEAACGYELDPENLAGTPNLPPWLAAPPRQRPVFDRLLAQGNLGGAWMCLNSSPWTYDEAREAIGRLAATAKDPNFSMLASIWSAIPHDGGLDY